MEVLHRRNSLGQLYLLWEKDDKTIISNNSNRITVDQKLDTINRCWYHWQMKGEAIQVAFPMLSGAEREFILTGITSEQWNDIFSEKEENES